MDVSFTERKRLSINGLNNSFSKRKSLAFEQNDNNDEAERIKRRKEVALQKRLSTVQSPASNKSLEPNVGNIKEHFDTCLHMFTHNKINSSNAWNLHIIDYMRTLVNSKDETKNILQIASTSLDIGAKVYSLRVDDVYNEVLKLANKLTRLNFNDNTNENNSEEEDVEENELKKTKKTKKKRILDHEGKRVTAYDYDECLNGIIQKHLMTDTITCNNKLLNLTLEKSPGNRCELLVPELSKKHLWITKEKIKSEFKTLSLTLDELSTSMICAQFNGFAIDLWDENNDNTFRTNNSYNEVNYNDDGIPVADIDIENIDPQDNVMDITEEVVAHKALDELYITDMKPLFGKNFSGGMLEYSYRPPPSINEQFNIIGAWAGPSHWKLKVLRKNYKADTEKNEKVVKTKKLKPVSEPFKIDMNVWNKFDSILDLDKKKKSRTKMNITNSFDACTLPEKLQIEQNFWMRINLIPQYKLTIHENDDLRKDLNVSNYDYNNPNDNEYCNDEMNNEGWDQNSNSSVIEQFGENLGFENENFTEDDYVTAPEMVPNNPVAYALKAKRMDMKKLKSAIWEELIEVDLSSEMSNLKITEENKRIERKVLSEVYMKLPNKLSQTYAENLSSPLAYVALLHLANEYNLKIMPSDNHRDIIISRDEG